MMTRGEMIQIKLKAMREQVERTVAASLADHEARRRSVHQLSETLDHLEDSGWGVSMVDPEPAPQVDDNLTMPLVIRISSDGFPIVELDMINCVATAIATRSKPNFWTPMLIRDPQQLGRLLNLHRDIVPQRRIIEAIPERIWNAQSVRKIRGEKRPGPRKSSIPVDHRGLMRSESQGGISQWITAEEMAAAMERRSAELIARHGEPPGRPVADGLR